jgi:uncharacterized spore protein YtfJ
VPYCVNSAAGGGGGGGAGFVPTSFLLQESKADIIKLKRIFIFITNG